MYIYEKGLTKKIGKLKKVKGWTMNSELGILSNVLTFSGSKF